MTDAPLDSPSLAYATTHAREVRPGCTHQLGCRCDPPHYLRCESMQQGERCGLGDGHGGEHVFKGERDAHPA